MDELKLQFDTLEVNTDLATKYISAHNGEFLERSDSFVSDNVNNKLYCGDRQTISSPSTPAKTDENSTVIDRAVFEKLAQKIEENAELFSQLEALIRKKRKEEVKKWDIQLIVKNLLYHSAQDFAYGQRNEEVTYIHTIFDNSPLACLGRVVERLLEYKEVIICAAPNAGVVCHLFTKLCHEVGLTQVKLQFDGKNDIDPLRDVASVCLGVVTAQSDIESAVDTLLSSSVQYPWQVEHILIQESVYDIVRQTFKRKYGLKTVDLKYKTCTDAMVYGKKMIIFDNATNDAIETEKGIDVIIFVEAYRTTKELIALVNKERPFCVSLWCSNGAEADEIAFSVNTQVVWINEFGSFWGPPDASQAFYSLKEKYTTPQEDSDVDKYLKVIEAWKKVDIKTRKAIVKEVIENCADHEDHKDKVLKLIRSRWSEKETFVEVQNNRMCIGERELGDVLLHVKSDIEEAITYLISGKAVIVRSGDAVFKDWLGALARKGLPVIFKANLLQTSAITGKGDRRKYAIFESNTKVVYKNFGTIFAN